MEKINKVKKALKVIGVSLLFMGATLGIAGCTSNYSPEEYNIAVEDAKEFGYNDGVLSVDTTSDNDDAITNFLTSNEVAYEIDENGGIILVGPAIEEPTDGSEEVIYELDNLILGTSFNARIDDGDLDKLLDKKIKFNDDKYDIHELISLSDDAEIAINGYVGYDEDMGASPYLTFTAKDTIKYEYIFDDTINVDDIDEKETLTIEFLGKEIEIIEIDENEMTMISGTELSLDIGEVDEISGISVLSVSEDGDSAVIYYGDATDVIEEGEVVDFGDLEIYVSDVFAGHNDYGFVELRYGEDIKTEIEDGDEYTEDSDWKWFFNIEEDELSKLGVTYDAKLDDFDDGELIALGESFALPEEYVTMTFKEIEPTDVNTYNFEFEEYEDEINTLHIESEDDEGIVVDGEEVSEVWFDGKNTYYEIDNDEFTYEGNPTLVYDNTNVEVSYNGNNIVLDGLDIKFATDNFEYLGNEEEDSDEAEFWYNAFDISDRDVDTLTAYGAIIREHEDRDEFDIVVPSEEVEATVSFQ